MFISRKKYEELEAEIFLLNVEREDQKELIDEIFRVTVENEELTNSLRRSYLNAITQRLQGYDEGYNDGVRDIMVSEWNNVTTACECGCYEEWDEEKDCN